MAIAPGPLVCLVWFMVLLYKEKADFGSYSEVCGNTVAHFY